ncbi:lipase family alpha/beta hydrolase [Nocardia jejuensis]|uniref:lipase family alpha/beta hydrolase n=1 Tax=Nocardia jejuensis TaxID=328049 RepID=UPI000A01A6D7|nr:alpha/beta fold hydrolase [Nocardia jejuensis]
MPTHRPTRRTPVRRLLATAIFTCAAALSSTGPVSAQPTYPVPYGLGEGLAHYFDPSSPPGANDWNCRPTPEHPEPVILLHGLTATQAADWATLAPLLANNGYCVFALNYGMESRLPAPLNTVPGLRSMVESATEELAPFVDRVLAATGAAKVDFVGHSEGTVMPRWYIKYLGGAAKVAKSVNLTPINNGTQANGGALIGSLLSRVGLWDGAQQLMVNSGAGAAVQLATGSNFLASLNSGTAYEPDIRYTFIMTRYDEIVLPYTSGFGPLAPNITNIVVQDQCPLALFEHNGASSDPVAAQHVLNALDPENAVPVNCSGRPRNG